MGGEKKSQRIVAGKMLKFEAAIQQANRKLMHCYMPQFWDSFYESHKNTSRVKFMQRFQLNFFPEASEKCWKCFRLPFAAKANLLRTQLWIGLNFNGTENFFPSSIWKHFEFINNSESSFVSQTVCLLPSDSRIHFNSLKIMQYAWLNIFHLAKNISERKCCKNEVSSSSCELTRCFLMIQSSQKVAFGFVFYLSRIFPSF